MARSATPNLPSTSIVIADCVARGHVNTGLYCHGELQRVYNEATAAGTAVDVPLALSLAIPSVSNLALGLEIFLKIHHFQNAGVYPTGHDIGALATSFSTEIQNGLRGLYIVASSSEQARSAATLKLAVGEERAELGVLWPEDAPDLDAAAVLLGRAYERWRYIYEELRGPLVATIAFKPLIAMVSTFDFAIRSFRSEAFVTVGENAA
jgi:hypothetical protein